MNRGWEEAWRGCRGWEARALPKKLLLWDLCTFCVPHETQCLAPTTKQPREAATRSSRSRSQRSTLTAFSPPLLNPPPFFHLQLLSLILSQTEPCKNYPDPLKLNVFVTHANVDVLDQAKWNGSGFFFPFTNQNNNKRSLYDIYMWPHFLFTLKMLWVEKKN